MSARTGIEWCDATWQVASGCSPVSGGCRNCYSARLAHTRLKHLPQLAGLTECTSRGVPFFNGAIRLHPARLIDPLRWSTPKRIFVGDRTDLFHPSIPDGYIDQVFAVMALCPQHLFLLLTKRPKRMREYIGEMKPWSPRVNSIREAVAAFQAFAADKTRGISFPLPNVWLGTSVEDQATADERIPSLLATPAAGRFISAEPLLGPIDIQRWIESCHAARSDGECIAPSCPQLRDGEPARSGRHCPIDDWDTVDEWEAPPKLDWVIVGGESGPGARPMHPAWVRSIRDQCAAAGIPLFFKQWGEWNTAAFNLATNQRVFRQFLSFEQWVNKAPTWIQGGVCLDNTGRVCSSGADFERARDENTFPITVMHRVGKSSAGRCLDGITHDALPPLPISSPLAGEVATPKLRRSEGRAGEGDRR